MKTTERNAVIAIGGLGIALVLAGISAAVHEWHFSGGQGVAIVATTTGIIACIVSVFLWLVIGPKSTATVVSEGRVVLGAGAGILLILWGQAFVALGFVASWRLIFPSNGSFPPKIGGGGIPSVSDFVQLLQALTVAPTWLGMTVVGTALIVTGAWLVKRSGS